MAELKAGDTVRLKSGGPLMTVAKIYNTDDGPRASCDWFEGSKQMREHFPVSSLNIENE